MCPGLTPLLGRLHFSCSSGSPQNLPAWVPCCCAPEMWLCGADVLLSPCGHCDFVVPVSRGRPAAGLSICRSSKHSHSSLWHNEETAGEEKQHKISSTSLPDLGFFLHCADFVNVPPKMSCILLLLHQVSVLSPSLLPPPLRKLSFHYAGSSIQRMPVLHKKILPLCSSFYTSFLLSGWRDLDFSKCQNPLSGWLSDQAPWWS